jgi:hypothetical protein
LLRLLGVREMGSVGPFGWRGRLRFWDWQGKVGREMFATSRAMNTTTYDISPQR